MTASARRRHRAVWGAAAGVVAGLVAVGGLGNAGRVAILNTTDGELQGGVVPEDVFPATPLTAIAVVDGTGALASLAVVVSAPATAAEPGLGGTIVVVPTNADVTNGFGDVRAPLRDEFAAAASSSSSDGTVAAGSSVAPGASGAERLADDLPRVLGVSLDEILVLDEPTFAAQLGAGDAAPATLLATAGTGYVEQVAAWHEIVDDFGTAEVDATFGSWWDDLRGGAVAVAALEPARPGISQPTTGADVVLLDRAEVVTLFAHIAPAHVAAPNAGFNFRVVSAFGDDQLAGASRYDLAYLATARLLGDDYNVLSVDTDPGDDPAGAATLVEVSDAGLVDGARSLEALFGPVDVRVAERRVAGVDVIVTLGSDFLAVAAADGAATPAPAAPAPSAPASDVTATPTAALVSTSPTATEAISSDA